MQSGNYPGKHPRALKFYKVLRVVKVLKVVNDPKVLRDPKDLKDPKDPTLSKVLKVSTLPAPGGLRHSPEINPITNPSNPSPP